MPDIGNAHVIAWYLWREHKSLVYVNRTLRTASDAAIVRQELVKKGYGPLLDLDDTSEDWSRYDGEIL